MTTPTPPPQPHIANFKNPLSQLFIMTEKGKVEVDMREVAKRVPDAAKGAIISIGTYINAKGERVPNYDDVKVEGEEL